MLDPEPHADESALSLIAKIDDLEAEIERHHRDFARWEDMADRAVLRQRAAEEEAWRLFGALDVLYESVPADACKADPPDGCPVCVAREEIKRYLDD